MENCTIYSHSVDFEKVIQIVKTHLPKAKVEFTDDGIQKSLEATIKGGFFSKNKTLKINYRQRKNPSYTLELVDCGLTQNLAGMINFIQSLSSDNEEVKNKFIIKVMAANSEMAFMVEPEIKAEFESLLRKMINELNAFIFAQPGGFFKRGSGQHFVDKNLNLILDGNGKCEIDDIDVTVDAKYHDQPASEYLPDQLERKERTEAFLIDNGIKVNKNLPCNPSATTVKIRPIKEVIGRAYALLIMGVKGEGIEQEHLERAVQSKKITSFTPKEISVYKDENLNDQDRAYATWRYESLYTLLWAMGKMETLKYPSEICDVKEVVGAIFDLSREEFENAVKLRSASEILDELDKIYRTNWACVDARIKGESPTGNVNPSIIYERHYALNWLTNYLDQDWDDVQTNT